MKKTLLLVGVVATLFSCGKDELAVVDAVDNTGTTVVSGVIYREDDNSGNDVAVEGAIVTVKVENEDLYPGANNVTGSKVYRGTTDANGKYSINVTTNGNGVDAEVSFSAVEVVTDPTTNATETYGYCCGTQQYELTSQK